MSTAENTFEVFLPSIEFEQHVLMITETNDYEEPVLSQSSLSDFVKKLLLSLKLRAL